MCLLSLILAFGLCQPVALAVDEEKQRTALELAQQVEETQSALADAQSKVDEANEAIAANEERIAEIEQEIPEQQKRSSQAYRELYKYQQQGAGVVELLLSAESFHDFLSSLQYATYIADANMSEIRRLDQLKSELDATEEELNKSRSEADALVDEAKTAMDAALEAQAEVQRRIEEDARREAEVAAAAAKLAEQPRENDQGSIESPSEAPAAEAPADSGEQAQQESNETTANAPAPVEISGDEAAFVNSWAPRIDAYLAGSPLAGQGATFARAAYTYNVDPRWSPAISCTESSKGLYCFNPHNAWGWGSSSWGSWEEAINDHVAGLSRGYGYTISEDAARKYCPPNWQHWYNTTLSQMNLI